VSKKNILIYTSGNISVALVPFFLTPFLTHHLSPAQFGQVAMFQVLLGLFCVFVGLSTNGALLRFNYNEVVTVNNRAKYFYNALILVTVSVIGVSGIYLLFADSLSNHLNINKNIILLALLTSIAMYFVKVRLAQWQVNMKPVPFAITQLVQSIFLIFLFFLFYVFLFDDEYARITSHFIVIFLLGLGCVYSLWKDKYLIDMSYSKEYIIDLLKQGLGIMPHLLGIYIISFADRLILNVYLDSASVGVFMLAIQVSLILNLFFDGINKAINPMLFRILKRNKASEKVKVVKYTYIIIIIVFLLMFPISQAGYYLVLLISPPEYQEAAIIVKYLIISQLLNGLYICFVNYILFSKKMLVLSSISISIGSLSILITILLIKELGIYAPVVSSLICSFLRLFIVFVTSNHLVKMPWNIFKRVM